MGMVLGIVPFFQDERTGKHFLQSDTAYGKLGLYIQDEDKAMAYSMQIARVRWGTAVRSSMACPHGAK